MQNKYTIFPSQAKICPNCKLQTRSDLPFCERCKFDLRHGNVRIKSKRGKCIYCFEIAKLSEEHIFPSWLRKIYKPRYSSSIHTLTRPATYEPDALIHTIQYESQNDVYHISVRNVCTSCNNGWMSNLQTLAKPIVKKLADGDWFELTVDQQQILTRWTVMLAINFQSYGRQLCASAHQRTTLKDGKIPGGWRVFIGSMKDDSCAGYSFTRPNCALNMQDVDGTALTAVSAFFCIESAAFYTFSASNEHTLNYARYADLDCDHVKLRQIFPNNDPAGALGFGLRREDLNAIQLRFGPIPEKHF